MKIRVAPEGRDGVYLCEKNEAVKYVESFPEEQIHNFIMGGPCLLGADWDKESVIEEINRSERIAILTGDALKDNYRHSLSVISNNKLYMFDIGEITDKDLEIVSMEEINQGE